VLELRPLAPDHADELRRIRSAPEVSRWWDEPEDDFPLADDPESTRLTIFVDGRVAGLIQYWEETDPKYRRASIDLYVAPEHHGKGVGPAAIRHVLRELAARGHHRVVIDPAVDNRAAIRAYEKVGFTPVGIMHAYERDADRQGWHDGLLMELLL
jgi:aminoglycoside 6'-N-acetyltransferase